ncbi:four helix bundle protein, partial [bacterium]|nr:four helix bundle protein [bacterium]
NLPNEYKYSIGNNLIRAGLSVANNIAEGNDKTSNKERNRFLSISSDSARECVSVFIILKKQNILEEDKFWRLKNLTREITSMLRGLKRYNS